MKKFASLLLVVAMLVTAFAVTAFAATPGNEVTVSFNISNNPGFANFRAELSYDTSALELKSFDAGSMLTNGLASPNIAKATFGWMRTTPDVTANGTLFTATFAIKAGANPGTYPISVSITSASNAAAQKVSLTVSGASITVDCAHAEWTDATCTAPKTCKGCGATSGEKLGHDYSVWTMVSETEHSKTCSRCDDTVTESHKEGTAATCKDAAKCSVCNATYGSVSETHGKTEVRGAVAETCVDDGYTGDTYCLVCGDKTATGSVITAKGYHVDENDKWESNGEKHWHTCGCGAKFDEAAHSGGTATCKEAAKCSACNTAYGEKDANNHVGGTEIKNVVEATCAKEGYTGDTCCKSCGVKLAAGDKTAMIDHTWNAGKVTTQATCTTEGVKTYTCESCKTATKTEPIPVSTEHVLNNTTNNGDGTHTSTCACGDHTNTASHTYNINGSITVKPTTSSEGKQEMLCACGAKTTKTLDKLASNEGELDDVPPTGDITMQITLGVVAMISIAAAAAFVFNRKIAK